jgi:tetratricopeptide (TPR) repeat protein
VLVEAEKFGPEDRRVALTLNKLAGLYHSEDGSVKPNSLYRRALAIWEKLPERMELASTLNNLARLCLDQEKYDEVVALSKRALGISESDAPNGPQVANSLNNLADVQAIEGRHAEAEPLYGQALTILEHSFGPQHPEVAYGLSHLAKLRFLQAHARLGQCNAEPHHPQNAPGQGLFLATALNNLRRGC